MRLLYVSKYIWKKRHKQAEQKDETGDIKDGGSK